jgi:hypothetical protein
MTRRPKYPFSGEEAKSDEDTVELETMRAAAPSPPGGPRVVPVNENEVGIIAHDERGRASWQWKAEVAESADPNAETFNYLTALDSELEIEQSRRTRVLEISMKAGLNPYDTARLNKPK